MLLKPHYFVHLEVPKTLRRVVAGGAAADHQRPRADRADRRGRQAGDPGRHPDRDRARRLRAARRGGDDRRATRTRCRSRCSTARAPAAAIEPGAIDPRGRRRGARDPGPRRSGAAPSPGSRRPAVRPPEPAGERPLVSFFVTAYRQEHLVRAAIEAAFAQTWQPLEILLSDDASPDGTYRGDAGDGRGLPRAAPGDPEPQPEEPRDHRPRRPDHGADLRRLRRAERRRRRLGAGAHRRARRRLARLGAAAEGDPLGPPADGRGGRPARGGRRRPGARRHDAARGDPRPRHPGRRHPRLGPRRSGRPSGRSGRRRSSTTSRPPSAPA